MRAGGGGAAHEIEADLVVVAREPVELEPQDVGRQLRRPLDIDARESAPSVYGTRAAWAAVAM